MSKFPRIFSFSTVGIKMHYNQDYLLHEVRTDFVGDNGIGKSLIADLFQVLFITDRKKIYFGTESFKNQERLVHTLPYNTSDAYVFINVEYKKSRFVTIGVNIPNKKSRPIRSFWILNQVYSNDDRKDLDILGFDKSNIPLNKDFIDGNEFLPIDKLTIHLREKKNLFLKYFTEKEDKKEYYEFLYQQELMPINLAIDESLDAYAKIIQSFSKAKTLDTESDKVLKDFLFENNSKTLEGQYKSNKEKLEKLITDFEDLDTEINLIEDKQERLTTLKKLEKSKVKAHKQLILTQYSNTLTDIEKCTEELKKATKAVKTEENSIEKLELSIPKMQKKLDAIIPANKKLAEGLLVFNDYEQLFLEVESLESKLDDLANIKPPDVSKENHIDVDLNQYEPNEIIKRIEALDEIFEQFKTLKELEDAIQSQSDHIDNRKTLLKSSLSEVISYRDILSENSETSLIGQLLKAGKKLSKAQETVLFGILKDVSWKKPKSAVLNSKYTDSLNLLYDSEIDEDKDNKGYWIKFDKLSTFVPCNNKKQIFIDKKGFAKAIHERIQELNTDEKVINNELEEIQNFSKGLPYNNKTIRLDIILNQNIKDFTTLESSKTTIGIVQNLSKKIKADQKEINELNTKLKALEEKIPYKLSDKNITEQLKAYSAIADKENETQRKLESSIFSDGNILKEKKEKLVSLIALNGKATETLESKQDYFKKIIKEFTQHFPDEDIKKEIPKTEEQLTIEVLEANSKNTREVYITEYGKISAKFEVLADDIEIDQQLSKKTYSFSVLEQQLLGPKIRFTENISESLQSSNINRTKVMEAIQTAMLRIFKQTKKKYDEYKTTVVNLNAFFKDKKISRKYYFKIDFKENENFQIDWLKSLQSTTQYVHNSSQLPFSNSVEEFVEKIFSESTGFKEGVKFADLLDPKTYFDLETRLIDENGIQQPGSTGQSYTALVLLGIGRLSIVEESKRKGLKFLILEEVSNMDKGNFNTFPDIAEEFGYQILTMTPEPYGSSTDKGWYLHHLFEGYDDKYINYPIPSSYYKTSEGNTDLQTYLNTKTKQ